MCGVTAGTRDAIADRLWEGAAHDEVIRELRNVGLSGREAETIVSTVSSDLEAAERESKRAARRAGRRDLVIGAVLVAAGASLTWYSYARAAPGGTYFVLWGAILFGAYRLLIGFLRIGTGRQ